MLLIWPISVTKVCCNKGSLPPGPTTMSGGTEVLAVPEKPFNGPHLLPKFTYRRSAVEEIANASGPLDGLWPRHASQQETPAL
jgi:hypothetical protein